MKKNKQYNWLTQNSKIKKMSGLKTFNWGIPAYKSKDGFKTCPNAASCITGCYANSGSYLFSNVAKVFNKRLEFSQSNEFVAGMLAELTRRKVQRVRIHDSGDFYSEEYLKKWLTIMRVKPGIEFYAYTKMISLFNQYKDAGLIPSNFKVIYSYGGTEDKLINPNQDRHSMVFETLEQLQSEGYADASKDDSVALGENNKIGLVYHGNRLYTGTNWYKIKR